MSAAFPFRSSGRVLVTGQQGFTGSYLASDLEAAGYTLCTPASELAPSYDLTNRDSLLRVLDQTQPDFIIHLGGISFVERDNAAAFYAVNTVGTSNLLEAVSQAVPEVRAIILASSAGIYGNPNVDLIDESVAPGPVNDYACSKLAMEFLARTWSDELPIIITRPFNYTGVGQGNEFVVPKIIEHFAREAPEIELGTLDVVRDFSDVRTTSQIYCRLLESGAPGETYNICSGEGHSLRWIVEQVAEISGHTAEVKISPGFSRRADVTRQVGSAAKLRRAIGSVKQISFAHTLRWMYETRRSQVAATAPSEKV